MLPPFRKTRPAQPVPTKAENHISLCAENGGKVTDKDLGYIWQGSYQQDYLDFSYDLLGNLTYEAAHWLVPGDTFTYNSAGRLTTVTSDYSDANNPATLISGMHYNAFGGLVSDTLGDNETETYTYVLKLTRLQSYTASYNNAPIYSFNITSFAPNGNVLAATDTANGNWNYSYDQFNRLVCANLASNGTCTTPPTGTPTYTYVYDRFGNRWQQNGPQSFIASFTGNNTTNNNRMDGYSYDAAGNLMNDGTHQYTYDAENRIVSVDNGNTATYAYDADGNRVEKISSGSGEFGDPAGTWQFLYDQSGRLLAKAEGAGWAGEVYAGSRHLATIGGGTSFNHADWLGTFRLQTIAQYISNPWYYTSCASLPFGDGLACKGVGSGNPTLNMRTTEIFTGKPRDFESGLDYFGARFDASSMGRFMSPDWSASQSPVPYADFPDPQSLNLYTYVQNNPLKSTDPTGHCTVDGEKHWGWCLWHSLGFYETKKEAAEKQAAVAAYARYRKNMIEKLGYDPDLGLFLAFNAGMLAAAASTEGGGDTGTTAAPEESAASAGAEAGWVRVGRWMSKAELAEMEATGTAVESSELGSSRVALPASPDTWKAAPAGDVYVEYDIPAGSAKPFSSGQMKIPGSNSTEARLAAQKGNPAPTMPPVRNIKVVKTK